MSLLETLNTHPCVICISSCPLLKCTAMTEYCVLRSRWTGIVFDLVNFVVTLCFTTTKRSKTYEFQTLWLMMSDGKLHFWGGANIVGPIFVIVNLLAPVCSLNGSSPCGVTVRLVWAPAGDPEPVITAGDSQVSEQGRLRYWRMCFWETWGTHFELSTWKQYIVRLASWQEIKIKSGILLLVIQCFFLLCCFYQGL